MTYKPQNFKRMEDAVKALLIRDGLSRIDRKRFLFKYITEVEGKNISDELIDFCFDICEKYISLIRRRQEVQKRRPDLAFYEDKERRKTLFNNEGVMSETNER